MSTVLVTTKDNHDSITLSVDVHDMKATTSIFLNNMLIKTIEGSFSDFFLGTNQGLNGNAVTVTTQVFRFPPEAETSSVDYILNGAAEVKPDNPVNSSKPFIDGVPLASHFMSYFFV